MIIAANIASTRDPSRRPPRRRRRDPSSGRPHSTHAHGARRAATGVVVEEHALRKP
jgi:hypothetical protein